MFNLFHFNKLVDSNGIRISNFVLPWRLLPIVSFKHQLGYTSRYYRMNPPGQDIATHFDTNSRQSHGLLTNATTNVTSPTAGSHFLSLSSNHKLGYHICGDLSGQPTFYYLGSHSSRLQAEDWHKIGIEMNLCIIGVVRPGIGLSTLRPGYTLVDRPHDIQKMAEHLGLQTSASSVASVVDHMRLHARTSCRGAS